MKKGFTLIELLAVIVILAIIALIATPIILNIIGDSKKESDKRSIELYGKAIELAIARKNLTEEVPTGNYVANGKTLTLKDSEFRLTVDYENNQVECATTVINEDGTVYLDECTVNGVKVDYYYGAKEDNAKNKLKEILNSAPNNDNIFKDEHGDIRYRGSTPDNYVTFNDELWRIIGYVDGHVKLIKAELSTEEMLWDSEGKSDWTKASLMKYLNPSDAEGNDTDGEYWTTLKETAKNMIEKTTWHLGGYSFVEGPTVLESYKVERGTDVYEGYATKWEGYVGLMYPSDYGYAASEACSSGIRLDWFGSSDHGSCQNTDWMFLDSEWTITPSIISGSYVEYIESTGHLEMGGHPLSYPDYVRPVVNLKSSVKITGGTGKQNDPFQLSMS